MSNVFHKFVFVGTVLITAALVIAGAARYAEAQGKPGSSVIELCPPVSAGANVTGVAPVPLGTQIRVGTRLVDVLKVMSAASGGTLDVYFQHSADDGQTWCDFAHVQQTAGSASTYYMPISTIAAGGSSVSAIQDGSSSANTATQGPVGDRLRIKYSVGSFSGSTPWNFQAFVLPD